MVLFLQDPPSKSPNLSRQSSKSSTPSKLSRKVSQPSTLQLDNPLYHVCEGKQNITFISAFGFCFLIFTNPYAVDIPGIIERRKLRPHQSVNSTAPTASTLNKSQSTGELASRNDNGNNKGMSSSKHLIH